jgi:hypothetical protein
MYIQIIFYDYVFSFKNMTHKDENNSFAFSYINCAFMTVQILSPFEALYLYGN